ncbi:TRAP transporter large permease [Leisingera sp. ANG-Vp]|uniref:TRAP transporter large permease n=1 Tax=Leisingera sp. ANG-Vp TaxID=1577896 RepID=UPI0005807594|nr:TRAP transporter large permease [Leisingera sp. ANG-Vp]KIC22785.1 C4-dicarboxylate ABC transporter permease [Leisingera sp. ANG-Vp]
MTLAIVFILLCLLLVIGLPVPFAFGAVLLYLGWAAETDIANFLSSGHWRMNNIVLLAIPLFILSGAIMNRGKLAEPLVDMASLFLGRFRGGLSAAAVLASAIFGSISGSAAATLTCIGGVMLPRLERHNYPKGFSAALIANAAPLGLLIPPSSIQIIYAWVTRQSVLKCFLATVVPGIILITLLCLVNWVLMRTRREIVLEGAPQSLMAETRRRTAFATPALLMPVIILGGIYGGVMTPTEAAAIAVFYALPVGFWVYRGLNWQTFKEAVIESGVTTGAVMVMFFMVMIVSRLLVFEDIPALAQEFIYSVSENPIVILLMINIVLVAIGMLMDDVSGVLLSAPLLLPVVQDLGVDPVQFAAIIGVNLGMGNITPPTAPLLYLGARVGQTSVQSMLKPTLLMIAFAWIPTLLLTTYIPDVALALPDYVLGY